MARVRDRSHSRSRDADKRTRLLFFHGLTERLDGRWTTSRGLLSLGSTNRHSPLSPLVANAASTVGDSADDILRGTLCWVADADSTSEL